LHFLPICIFMILELHINGTKTNVGFLVLSCFVPYVIFWKKYFMFSSFF
jgi:hypothetical protein